ncbi:MAG: hypothetical protein N2651_09915 [Fimbriimonadales bacterium]|nr:hypothetical protein [Fimbriimonadales bacterium]
MKRLLVSGAALVAAIWTASAQVLYSTGFEEFNLGAINGQFS